MMHKSNDDKNIEENLKILMKELADTKSKLKESVPVKRIGTPDDVAYAVMTFLNPDASYLTGQVLYVCGGRSLSSPSV